MMRTVAQSRAWAPRSAGRDDDDAVSLPLLQSGKVTGEEFIVRYGTLHLTFIRQRIGK